jgi:GAF domain-containing protein
MRLVELFELQLEEGPCFDAYSGQVPVVSDSFEDAVTRWPRFAPHASDAGFEAISAVPMRLRSQVIGALNLFSTERGTLGDDDLRVAQAMADIATIGILQERAIRDSRALSTQLELALESRIVIEQAKGIVAEHDQTSVDEAFQRLRRFARDHNRLLSDTARQVIDRSLEPADLSRGATSSTHRPGRA